MIAGQVIERGGLMFTKKLSRGPNVGSDLTFTTKSAIAVMVLGGTKDVEWNQKTFEHAVMSLGWTCFDDVEECLGIDAMTKLMKFVEEKYK